MQTSKFDYWIFSTQGWNIFTSNDRKNHYLFCSTKLLNDVSGDDNYIGIRVSEKELEDVKNGTKKLHVLFAHSKSKLFYPCRIKRNLVLMPHLSIRDLIKKILCPPVEFSIV